MELSSALQHSVVLQPIMALTFYRKADVKTRKLGVLPGTFNPPTCAHLAIGRAGLSVVDEVVFVLPRALPHKDFSGVSFQDRLRLLQQATINESRFSVAASDEGLFISIARECRDVYGSDVECVFLCGRDAAERIVNWDYGEPGAFPKMLTEFSMLVASREGAYDPPAEMETLIRPLPLGITCDHISAT